MVEARRSSRICAGSAHHSVTLSTGESVWGRMRETKNENTNPAERGRRNLFGIGGEERSGRGTDDLTLKMYCTDQSPRFGRVESGLSPIEDQKIK